MEDLVNVSGDLDISTHPNGKNNSFRAEPNCLTHGHRTVNAEFSGFIGAGNYDSSFLGRCPYKHRFTL